MSLTSIVLEQTGRRGARRPQSWSKRRAPARLLIESLEVRTLLSGATGAAALPTYLPNETIDQAWDLGSLSPTSTSLGSVGLGPDGATDVTWYHFHLPDAAQVDLSIGTPEGDRPFDGVLSLYDSDPYDWGDPYDSSGYRLMAQVQTDPQDGAASYVQDLGPGDYFVAVSGAGNTAFSPVIAGSGLPGAIGIYELTAGATDLGLAGDGATMLWADPASGAVVDGSPLAIRVGLSAPLDPATIADGQTVQLLAVSGGVETPIPASTNLSTTGDELQLFPDAPLAPGQYIVQLSGDDSQGQPVLAGYNGLPLGEDAQNPDGADESFTFQVDGVDGVAGATASDDTPATAQDLGDLVGAGIVQAAGAIGIDPNLSADPANQVDLYHFQITGPGHYAMLAEVFAGRIGSPLDPGLSLFELDPSTGQLVFLAGDNNTLNPAEGTDGTVPLLLDSALTDGLTAGNYYLAVADGSNTPSPIEGQMPDSPGIFDPNEPDSAQNGWSTGAYLLNVTVQPSAGPPQVVASSPSPGEVLDQAPTQITVQFSEPVNLQQLAFQAYEATYQATLPQVYIEGADGARYEPRFVSYDRSTNTATFEVLDQLPNGSYVLDLSGPGGLTDLAGDPLPGNTPDGDDVIPFSVESTTPVLSGSQSSGFWTVAQPGAGVPQDVGTLFPDQLQAGVSLLRYPVSPAAPGADSTQDQYVIQLMEYQDYSFQLIGADVPPTATVSLTDASGQPVGIQSGGGQDYFAYLMPGTYTVTVGGWSPGDGADLSYMLLMTFSGQQDNPPVLVDGPAPSLVVSFATSAGSPPGLDPIMHGPEGVGSSPAPDDPAGPGGTIPGPSGEDGPVAGGPVGGPGAVSSSGSPALGFPQAEAAISLAGLGMGPLGGSGSQAGPLAAPAVQVTLNGPTGASTISAITASLVTMTRMVSWDREGQATTEPDEDARTTVVATADPAAAADAPIGPREEAPATAPGLTPAGPAPGLTPAGPAPGPSTATNLLESPAGPAPGPSIARNLPATPAAGVASAGDGPTPTAVAPRAPAVARSGRAEGEDHWTARWIVAAATLAAAYRSRSLIRGLEWKKGVRLGRPDRPTGPGGPHVAAPRARRGRRAASPRL